MGGTGDVGSLMQVSSDDMEADIGVSLGEEDEEEVLIAGNSGGVELVDDNPAEDLEGNSPTEKAGEVRGSEPFVGMVFQSPVVAYRFYIEYAIRVGFVVRKKLCRRSRVNNEIIACWYVCTREGKSVANEKKDNFHYSIRSGCQAAVKVKRMANKEWKVIHFDKEHNHELDPGTASVVRYHRRNRVLRKRRIRITHVIQKDTSVIFSEQSIGPDEECRNSTNKAQCRFFPSVDVHAIHMLFMHMHSKNPAFFYAVEFDTEQHLKNVFWTDAKAKVAYIHFGDVVTFDTTFLTDRYQVPFAPFIGVNHHGKSVLLGCALLADASTASFVWLFKTWLDAMSGRHPKAIITDYNKDIAAAVMQVFPKTRHRFCIWHILQRVPVKLGDVCEAHENFLKKLYKCVYDSTLDEEFERRWWKLIERFGLANKEWLQSLYKDRRQWVPLYLKNTFFAGMSISQRGESITTVFDKCINHGTSLKEFLEKYEPALESMFEEEAQEDFRSLHSRPKERMYPSPFELQLATVYTRNMFQKFQSEVLGISSVSASKIEENGEITTYKVKAYEVQEENINRRVIEKEYKVVWNAKKRKIGCICQLFEFKGYLCRHSLVVFLALGVVEIPPCYILKRWTIDAKSRNLLDEGYAENGDCSKSAAQRFNDICSRSFKFAEEAALSKRSYDVALLALQEAFRKVTHANNTGERSGQPNYTQSSGCYYKASDINQSNMGNMPSVCELEGSITQLTDKLNVASKQNNDLPRSSKQLDQSFDMGSYAFKSTIDH